MWCTLPPVWRETGGSFPNSAALLHTISSQQGLDLSAEDFPCGVCMISLLITAADQPTQDAGRQIWTTRGWFIAPPDSKPDPKHPEACKHGFHNQRDYFHHVGHIFIKLTEWKLSV